MLPCALPGCCGRVLLHYATTESEASAWECRRLRVGDRCVGRVAWLTCCLHRPNSSGGGSLPVCHRSAADSHGRLSPGMGSPTKDDKDKSQSLPARFKWSFWDGIAAFACHWSLRYACPRFRSLIRGLQAELFIWRLAAVFVRCRQWAPAGIGRNHCGRTSETFGLQPFRELD